jgi:hypothetical protein
MFEGLWAGNYLKIAWVVVSHYLASFSTLLIPSTISNGCWYSIAACTALLLLNSALIFFSILKFKKE